MAKSRIREAVQTLVQLNLNQDKYDEDKSAGDGRHLVPFKCNSTQIAAYRFKPEIEYTLEDVAKAAADFDNDKSQLTEEDEHIKTLRRKLGSMQSEKTQEILQQYRGSGTYTEDQVVFWDRNSKNNGDEKLRQRFSADSLLKLPRPKAPTHDRVGLAESFRIRQQTLNSLRNNSQKLTVDQIPQLKNAVRLERERQEKSLRKVREKMIEIIRNSWNQTIQSLPVGHALRDLRIDVKDGDEFTAIVSLDKSENLEINSQSTYSHSIKIARLIDLHREFVRVSQLLNVVSKTFALTKDK